MYKNVDKVERKLIETKGFSTYFFLTIGTQKFDLAFMS